MDLDAFECPICFSVFQGPIFQCKNGHVVCDSCRVRIRGTCPSCREPVGDIRCRALENAIAGMVVPCAFTSHGCTQLLKLKERQHHEAFLCQHAPFACPLQPCAYSAASAVLLHDHIQDAHAGDNGVLFRSGSWEVWLHRSMPFKVLLDPVHRRVFLLLNGGGVGSSGRSLSLVCLGGPSKPPLEYTLEVGGCGDEPGALALSASGSVPCVRRWAGQYPTDGFLFVPDAYSLNSVVVNVCVQKSAAIGRLASLVGVRRHLASLDSLDLLLMVLVFVLLVMAVVVVSGKRRRVLGSFFCSEVDGSPLPSCTAY